MPIRRLTPVLVTTLTALSTLPAYGLGFRIPDQSATAVARGDAFAATADDPSAVYYNPAGITQLSGTHALLNGYGIAFNARVNLKAPGSKDFDNKWDPQIAPQTFSTYQLFGSPVWFGFGVYVPFGLKNRYSDDVPFRNIAKEGNIQYVTYNPVLAWKVTERFSIAAGLTINHASASLVQGVFSKGDQFRFDGTDTSFGFNAGLMWQPHPMHSFGVTYVSETTMDFGGETHTHFPDQHRIVAVAPGVFAPITIPGRRCRPRRLRERALPATYHRRLLVPPDQKLEPGVRSRLDGLGDAERRDPQTAHPAGPENPVQLPLLLPLRVRRHAQLWPLAHERRLHL